MKPPDVRIAIALPVFLLACGDAATESTTAKAAEAPPPSAPASPPAKPPEEAESRRVEISGYQDVLNLFETLNYTPKAWQAGIREVPRVYITEIPERWRAQTVNEITVLQKKRLFFRALAPLVLRSNELILTDRKRLAGVRKKETGSLSAEDAAWLSELSKRYDVTDAKSDPITPEGLDELWNRVDIIPVSLALSQGAEESGWGTSRFAAHGNALFGQWTWGSHGMTPEKQRKKLGNYGVAAFGSPLQSVIAYMLNLNTHSSYADLRARRAAARGRGEKPTGRDLAPGLSRYSERGEAYVQSLFTLMQANRLDPADDAHLGAGPPIYLYPAPDPSD